MFEGQWSNLALLCAFAIGVEMAAVALFLRWRSGKRAVPVQQWDSLISGYLELERALETTSVPADRTDALHDKLEAATAENGALHGRLMDLERHLDDVTGEATVLVNGLRDNETRWAEAEQLRLDLQEALAESERVLVLAAEKNASLALTNEELARRLQIADERLHDSNAQIQALQDNITRRAALEQRLTAALDNLEQRYRSTFDQLQAASSRTAELERAVGGVEGVVHRNEIRLPEPTIDLREPLAPRPEPRWPAERAPIRRVQHLTPSVLAGRSHSHGYLPD